MMVHDRHMSLYDKDSVLILVMATDVPGIRTVISGTCLLILPNSVPGCFQRRRLCIVFAVQVPCGTQMISSSIWHWLAATGKIKFKLLSFGQRTIFIFESWSDLLLQRVAGSREPAPASEGPGLRMGHFSSGAPLSLAF
jgi:hypothetical protein